MEQTSITPSSQETRLGWCFFAFGYLLLPQLVIRLLSGCGDAFSNFFYHLLLSLGVLLIFRRPLLCSLRRSLRKPGQLSIVCLLALIAHYFSLWAVTRTILLVQPEFVNRNNQVIQAMTRQQWLLTGITTVLLAPVEEETLFRCLLFQQLRDKSRWGAYVLSALCFGLIHLLGFLGSCTAEQFLLSLVQYLPVGLILAWSFDKTGSLTAPIVVHAIINAVSMVQILS
ncbi:MAG: CPBP family intramembrane glutamic endopeptidase [Candidatus Faecousia sp.]|nr:CPBP family intramembrane glutamic endopeptidase [Candidatus Faecousia sp.]